MARLTRRNILGAASAVAGGALIAAPAAASRAPAIDPIIALIVEADRLSTEGSVVSDRADKILFAMPEDIRRGPCVVMPDMDPDRLTDRQKRFLASLPEIDRADLTRPRPRPFRDEEDLRERIKATGVDGERAAAMIAEWRADKARIDHVLSHAGYTPLRQQADAIQARAGVLLDWIEEMQPRTVAGAIAQIEMTAFEDNPYIANALAGLRAIAAGGAA